MTTTTIANQSVAIRRTRRARLRHLWLVPGLALGLLASVQSAEYHLGIAPLLVFGIMPHLAVLLAIGQPHARGQMAARAVPLFRVMHHPVVPIAILAVALAGLVAPLGIVAALAWLGHIVVDWAFGEGIVDRDGFKRGPSALL